MNVLNALKRGNNNNNDNNDARNEVCQLLLNWDWDWDWDWMSMQIGFIWDSSVRDLWYANNLQIIQSFTYLLEIIINIWVGNLWNEDK